MAEDSSKSSGIPIITREYGDWAQFSNALTHNIERKRLLVPAQPDTPAGGPVLLRVVLPNGKSFDLPAEVTEVVDADDVGSRALRLRIDALTADDRAAIERAMAGSTPAPTNASTGKKRPSQAPAAENDAPSDALAAEMEVLERLVKDLARLQSARTDWDALGVPAGTSEEDLRAAYVRQAAWCDPERYAAFKSDTVREAARKALELLTERFSRLLDEMHRAAATPLADPPSRPSERPRARPRSKAPPPDPEVPPSPRPEPVQPVPHFAESDTETRRRALRSKLASGRHAPIDVQAARNILASGSKAGTAAAPGSAPNAPAAGQKAPGLPGGAKAPDPDALERLWKQAKRVKRHGLDDEYQRTVLRILELDPGHPEAKAALHEIRRSKAFPKKKDEEGGVLDRLLGKRRDS